MDFHSFMAFIYMPTLGHAIDNAYLRVVALTNICGKWMEEPHARWLCVSLMTLPYVVCMLVLILVSLLLVSMTWIVLETSMLHGRVAYWWFQRRFRDTDHYHKSVDGVLTRCFHKCKSIALNPAFWCGVTLTWPLEHVLWVRWIPQWFPSVKPFINYVTGDV